MTNFLKDRVAKIYQHPFFRKTLFTIIARLGGMSMQLAYFVLVARALTVHEYGMFIGVSAMASLLISFASFGSSDILVKYVSRDRSLFAKYWGNAILTGSIGSTFLIFTCLLASQLFFPDHGSPLVVFLVLLSDILCLMLWNISCDALGSHDKLYQVAQADILYSANKLIAAVILTLEVWESTLQTWAWLYCASSLATGLICVIFVNATLGMPKFQPSLALANIKEGIYFSLSYSADKVNGDIDKTMLASVATFEAAGIYAAGSRFLTAAYAPLHVLFKNAYMRYFKHGESGIQGSFGFAKRLLPAVVAYGCLIMVAFIGLAPLLPRVLGESYGETVTVLRWLSPYVLILGVQAIAGDSLTGAGFQSWRSGVNVAAALLNIALNLWMIPHYLWKGAIWSTLISDGSKLLVLWVMVLLLQYRDRNYAQGAVR
jgi:O-antigen/teichoic acid export membrane protein